MAHFQEFKGEGIIQPVILWITREDVETGNVGGALESLRSMIASPEKAESFRERVDVAFQGYDDDERALWEIDEVRDFVLRMDEAFPFWLFFLMKFGLGLQCIMLCLLPPVPADAAKRRLLRRKIQDILTSRWLPAMNSICEFARVSGGQVEALTERAISYIVDGPFRTCARTTSGENPGNS